MQLLVLTFALAFAPITFYYVSRDYLWDGTSPGCVYWWLLTLFPSGNSTMAAITAVVAANVVLAVYIFMSIKEERELAKATKTQKPSSSSPETKKTQ